MSHCITAWVLLAYIACVCVAPFFSQFILLLLVAGVISGWDLGKWFRK